MFIARKNISDLEAIPFRYRLGEVFRFRRYPQQKAVGFLVQRSDGGDIGRVCFKLKEVLLDKSGDFLLRKRPFRALK
jgi:hypothetical protein